MSRRLIVIGVSGVGKTTLGSALAERLGVAFLDADDLHPPANIAKMRRGEALTDADRWPWLDRVAEEIARARLVDRDLVIACSALKRSYRDRLWVADPALLFVYLEAPRAVLEARLRARPHHFMPATLVASQLSALEPPEKGESALQLDARQPIAELVEMIVRTGG